MIKEKIVESVGIVMIKPKSTESLCTSCHNRSNCALTTSQKGVYNCSEFTRENFLLKMDLSNSTSVDISKTVNEANGICKTCIECNSCTLIEEGTIKFYCEQYQ